MSEEVNQPPLPGTVEANDLVVRGADGDPVADPASTRMIERESYERAIEGTKMAADAAAHLGLIEPENRMTYHNLMIRLDLIRKIAVQTAGIQDNLNVYETARIRSRPMSWKKARAQFREGLRQAEGGFRQLAICHRGDLRFLEMANVIDLMERKLAGTAKRNTLSKLILPPRLYA